MIVAQIGGYGMLIFWVLIFWAWGYEFLTPTIRFVPYKFWKFIIVGNLCSSILFLIGIVLETVGH